MKFIVMTFKKKKGCYNNLQSGCLKEQKFILSYLEVTSLKSKCQQGLLPLNTLILAFLLASGSWQLSLVVLGGW